MTHLPFAIQALIWFFSLGFTVFLILLIVSATYRKGRPEFIWFDMWVGLFWDAKKRLLYVAPLPCIVFIYEIPKRQEDDLEEPSIHLGHDGRELPEVLEEDCTD